MICGTEAGVMIPAMLKGGEAMMAIRWKWVLDRMVEKRCDAPAMLGAGREHRGFTFLEIVVACAIMAIVCVGVLGAVLKVDQDNRYIYNCTIAHRAAHQMMEILLSMDLDDVIANQNGQTFTVNVPSGPPATGRITITDINWGGIGRAYEYRVTVPDYSVSLSTVRART
ncbi:MAG: type II secretion system GspH family protein [Planctomycetota bacterium]|nr:type II secretion system GspH family protein [Planctomycetota bacterium]